MKLIETTISGPFVHLLYADAATKDEATEWVEMRVKLPEDDNRRLGVIQKDALQRVRKLCNDENTRLQSLADSLRQ